MNRNITIVLAVVFSLSAGAWGEIKVTPVANVTLSGGQYSAEGTTPTGIGGNADIFFSPVINFSPESALLPLYTLNYSGTKDVRELIGGSMPAREMQDHALSFKYVQKLSSGIKLKARTGYKVEYVKETSDEAWGKGLFDYNKIGFGGEAEKSWESWIGKAGVDFHTMHYANYQSLISRPEYQSSLDTTTYSELSANAGKDVMDYTGIAFYGEAVHAFSPQFIGTLHYDMLLKQFKDQTLVQNTGLFSSGKRMDMAHYLTAGIRMVAPKTGFSLSTMIQYYDSNQNSFDIGRSHFISDYYDYFENTLMPSIDFTLGSGEKPSQLSFGWNVAWRQYMQRPAQYQDGEYKDDKVTQMTSTIRASYLYPISGNLSAKFSVNYCDASSNMKYENTYQYNYNTFNYFFGIHWEL